MVVNHMTHIVSTLGPQPEQQMLVTAEPSLLPLRSFFFLHFTLFLIVCMRIYLCVNVCDSSSRGSDFLF